MVLITYKSNTGTTKEAAKIIQRVFISKALDVELLEISKVKSIDKYDLVIIGAPINGMHWLPEASNFVSKNEIALKNKKVACFALSYIIVDGRNFWKNRVRSNFKTTCQLVDPIDIMIFGGKIDQRMPAPARFIFGLSKDAPLDYRNNLIIEKWANDLINEIKGF